MQQILCFGNNGNTSTNGRGSIFGTKKKFRIFRGQNNADVENKDSKQSTGGDKGVAICTPTSSKTFISDAMSQNNKKLNGLQSTTAPNFPVGNIQVQRTLLELSYLSKFTEINNYVPQCM